MGNNPAGKGAARDKSQSLAAQLDMKTKPHDHFFQNRDNIVKRTSEVRKEKAKPDKKVGSPGEAPISGFVPDTSDSVKITFTR